MAKSFTLEKIDEQTARKTDMRESVSIINIEDLREQKAWLEKEIADRRKMLAEIDEVLAEFGKLK